MTLPNKLTAARFLLAILGVACLLIPFTLHVTIAAVLFALAVFTDYLDGVLARQWQQTSVLGAFMDPLADKLLVFLYFTHFTLNGLYPEWLFLCILARDLLHDGLRNFAASKRVILGANTLSKGKTVFQMASLILALLCAAVPEFAGSPWSMTAEAVMFARGAMVVALVLGVLGSIQFVRQHGSVLTHGE